VISSFSTAAMTSRSCGTTSLVPPTSLTNAQCVFFPSSPQPLQLTTRLIQKWTESYTQWSPYGTLLATIHGPGVALWGGTSFDRLNRFAHPEVKLIDFSPFERYLVTWSPRPIEVSSDSRGPSPFTEEDEGNQIAVWDVMTGALLRTFPMVGDAAGPEMNKRIVWPMFKWSPDEKFLGRVTPGQQISVYEVPSMGLLGKRSLKVDGVVDFEWAPLSDKEKEDIEDERAGVTKQVDKKKAALPVRENTIAFWTPEVANQPARVTLMHLPSRTTIRSKNLFNVHDVSWRVGGSFSRGLIAHLFWLPSFRSARSTGNPTVTTSASRSIDTLRRRRLNTATSSFSVFAKRTAPFRSSRSRVRFSWSSLILPRQRESSPSFSRCRHCLRMGAQGRPLRPHHHQRSESRPSRAGRAPQDVRLVLRLRLAQGRLCPSQCVASLTCLFVA
jgi:hypothetical protein